MSNFSIEVRAATAGDVRLVPHANVSLEDGSAAVLVDGELVAVADEYSTAYLRAGTEATPDRDQVEKLLAAALEFYGSWCRASRWWHGAA